MKKIIIIECDDWQAAYMNGEKIDSGHVLGEGYGLLGFLQEIQEDYNLKIDVKDVVIRFAEDVDIDDANLNGDFPDKLSELKGNYSDIL